jgi:RimJ/RimL family protein N-acetyltransferase
MSTVAAPEGLREAPRPSIRKARVVAGNAYRLRNAEMRDAQFVLALRTDARKKRYISTTSPDLASQVEWLERYAADAGQAYFIVESMDAEPLGTVRMYDPRGTSFCFGSWIIRQGAPAACAVESVLLLYHYALDELGFSESYFSVRKPNRSVWHFMERFGARRTGENDLDYLYETDRASVTHAFGRYSRYLPAPIRVIRDPVS